MGHPGIVGSMKGRTPGRIRNYFSRGQAHQHGQVFFSLSHTHTHSQPYSFERRSSSLSWRRSRENLATIHCLALEECAVACAQRVTVRSVGRWAPLLWLGNILRETLTFWMEGLWSSYPGLLD
jgi:hypothetical protein